MSVDIECKKKIHNQINFWNSGLDKVKPIFYFKFLINSSELWIPQKEDNIYYMCQTSHAIVFIRSILKITSLRNSFLYSPTEAEIKRNWSEKLNQSSLCII